MSVIVRYMFTPYGMVRRAGYKVPSTCSYDDFVAASKELMKGRSPAAQHALVAKVLRSLMPSAVPGTFK